MGEGETNKGLFDLKGFFSFDRAKTIIKPKEANPIAIVLLSFLAIIIVGALLLVLPFSSKGEPTSLVDALFTATSATCVTGLVVKDTATHFSLFGQAVILILIQIGGLGYMTITTFFAILVGKKLGLGTRLALKENLNLSSISGVFRLARRVLVFIVTIESIGALILYLHWRNLGASLWSAIKYSIFHSISAFNNAGFDVLGGFKSLSDYASDPTILITISALFIAGGLGFIVVSNIYEAVFYKKRLSLQTKIVVVASIGLIFLGYIFLFSSEASNPETLGPMSLNQKTLNAYFQSASSRTAGFSTINIGDMTLNGLFVLIILMFIGASPGGTGGGIKTVTFVVILASIYSFIRGKNETDIGNRSIDNSLVMKAMTVLILSLALIVVITFALCAVNRFTFIENLFETASAFGTVGLSTGITPMLDIWSKMILMVAIYLGRVGILSFIFSMYTTKYISKVHLPKEELSVG